MTKLCCKVLQALEGKTLVTAESLTGGGIGASLTAIPGASRVYKGGIISYSDGVKQKILGVPQEVLNTCGAVSGQTAGCMVSGVRALLEADVAISVTGLAGPDADDHANPVGTVFIGYEDSRRKEVRHFLFAGNREEIRKQTEEKALELVLEMNK